MPSIHLTKLKFFLSGILLLGSLSTPLFALPEDRHKIAQLNANTADLNQQTHTGEYVGEVEFDQGTTHLRALRAITRGDKDNKLEFAAAFGDKTTPAHYWEQIALDKPVLHAYAQEIRYYPAKHLVELLGNARIVQGEDSFSAPDIRYDTEKQHVIAKSNATTRTQIIFHPGKSS